MYYQLNEGGVDQAVKKIGNAARTYLKSSQDDIIKFFETQAGRVIVADIDNIVTSAIKNKNMSEIYTLETQVYHMMNSGRGNYGDVSVEFKKFMDAYARSKGKGSWGAIRDEVTGTPKVNPSGKLGAASISSRLGGGSLNNLSFQGMDLSGTKYRSREDFNYMMSFEADRIVKGITTLSNGWGNVSSKGFQKYGITNMQEWLRKNVKEIRFAKPRTSEWEIKLKDVITPA